jgi:hypothetical protein
MEKSQQMTDRLSVREVAGWVAHITHHRRDTHRSVSPIASPRQGQKGPVLARAEGVA